VYLGVDYYPEQWPIEMLEDDLDNIVELGCNVIRIGEFAWHMMEKQEGKYDFSFFDYIIEKAKEKNLSVIFGTPTATMPAWLANQYSEVLSEFENGQKRVFGGRRQYCFNSKKYQEMSYRIVKELVEHYKAENGIIAWQIDNEFGHEGSDECFCANCQNAFRKFISDKYNNDINLVNETYGTKFWSQEYNSFEEIPLPKPTITTHNPSLRMDYELFRSKSIEDFAKMQYELIKSIIPSVTVIHDFPGGGLSKHVDYSKVAKVGMDIVAYNNYPVWGGQKEPIKPHEIAFGLDYMRGLKQQNFWITEAIMGAQGHDITGYLPRPNQAKLWSYQGMAHGCESLLYFRYRGYTKGAEQFCYGILDADNKKKRRFNESKEFFHEIKKYKKFLEIPIESKVCILYDYQSAAAFRIQRQSILMDYEEQLKEFYRPFFERNVSVDVLPIEADFSKYDLVVAPSMIIWTDERNNRMQNYVKNGGHLVLSFRHGVKDEFNNLTLGEELPVGTTDFIGATVWETESLQDYDAFKVEGLNDLAGVTGVGGVFRDMLKVSSAKSLLKYTDEFYKVFSAATENIFGMGKVYYVGCGLEPMVLSKLFEYILDTVNIQGIPSPIGVEVAARTSEKGKMIMIMNHNESEVVFGDTTLCGYECRISVE